MKACFINPPIEDFYYTSVRRQPLGLLYVMAAVEQAGHDAVLINCHSNKSAPLPLPKDYHYLQPFMDEGIYPFKGYRRYGMSFEEIGRRVQDSDADIFFVAAMFTTYHEETGRVINIIRDRRPGVPVAVGGHHATLHPRAFSGIADFILTGECEESAAALLSEVSAGNRRGPVIGPRSPAPVDGLPYPARRHLLSRDYKAYGRRAAALIASRGCPHRCDFCTSRVIWGDGYRPRDPEDVVREIDHCVRDLGVSMINFEDDNMLASPSRGRALLSRIAEYRSRGHSGLELTAMNGISVEAVDEDMVALMHEAGFREINLSLVTGSPGLQAAHGRPFDTGKFRRIASCAKKTGMKVRAYFILGLPDQTEAEVEHTVASITAEGAMIFPSVYYNVRSPENEWKTQRSSAFFNESADLPRRALIRWFNRCVELKVPRLTG